MSIRPLEIRSRTHSKSFKRRLSGWCKQTARRIKIIASSPRLANDVLLLVVVFAGSVMGINLVNATQPILGLKVENQMVGHLYDTSIEQEITRIIDRYENANITVQAADNTSRVSLRQLGVQIDRQKVYAEALHTGREGGPLKVLGSQLLASLGMVNIELGHPGFDDELAKQFIAALNQNVETPPVNAHFIYKGSAVAIQRDQPGQTIDIEAAVALLKQTKPVKGRVIELPVRQTQADITAAAIEPLLSEAQAVAGKHLTIIAGETRVTLSPEELVSLLALKVTGHPKNGAGKVELTFDQEKINAIANDVAGKVVRDPKPKIMNGSRLVQQGEQGVRVEGEASSYVLAALLQRQTGAAEPEEVTIPLVAVDPPTIQQSNPRTRTGTGLIRLTFDDGPAVTLTKYWTFWHGMTFTRHFTSLDKMCAATLRKCSGLSTRGTKFAATRSRIPILPECRGQRLQTSYPGPMRQYKRRSA